MLWSHEMWSLLIKEIRNRTWRMNHRGINRISGWHRRKHRIASWHWTLNNRVLHYLLRWWILSHRWRWQHIRTSHLWWWWNWLMLLLNPERNRGPMDHRLGDRRRRDWLNWCLDHGFLGWFRRRNRLLGRVLGSFTRQPGLLLLAAPLREATVTILHRVFHVL